MKRGLFGLVRAAKPNLDHFALYRARVVSQSADGSTVDVLPEFDIPPERRRLPAMSKVKIKLGIPGAKVKINPGVEVFVGWDSGDPQRPYAQLFDQSSATLVISIVAEKVELGGVGLAPALDGVVRAETPCQFTGAPHFVGGKTSLRVLATK